MGQLINFTGHGLVASDPIMLANLVGGEGLEENTTYYVLADGLTADAFKVSLTDGGAAVEFTTDITDGSIVGPDEYEVVTDGVMDPPETATAPTGLNLTSDAALDADGHTVTRLIATWDAATQPSIRQFVFEYTLVSGLYTNAARLVVAANQTSVIIPGVQSFTAYYGRLATQDVYGNLSPWATQDSVITEKDTTAPATPTGLVALPAVSGVGARWSNNTESDLSHYVVEVDNDSAFGSINRTFRVKTNTVMVPDLTAGTWYLRVRAVDLTGNESSNAAFITLTVGDEFGKSVIETSGFAGSWYDLVTLGLYNARFLEGSGGTNIATGRTAAMPYWTLSKPTGTPTFNHVANTGLRSLFAATIGQQTRMQADPVPVVPQVWMSTSIAMSWALNAAGNVALNAAIIWTKADGSASATSSTSLTYQNFGLSFSSTNTQAYEMDPVLVPVDAAYAHVRVTFTQGTAHTGNITLLAVGFKPAPPENMTGMELVADAFTRPDRFASNLAVTGLTLTTSNQTAVQEDLTQGDWLVNVQLQASVTGAGAGNIVAELVLEGVVQHTVRWVPDTADTGRSTMSMTYILTAASATASSNTMIVRVLKTINAGTALITASESNVTILPIN